MPEKQATHRHVAGAPAHTYPLLKNIAASQAMPRPGISISRGDSSTVLRIPLAADEAIWGFGERFDAFDLRGTELETWTTDGWNRLDTSYFAVPFYISSEGYGLFINCTGKVRFDIGKREPNILTVEIPDRGADLYFFEGKPADISRSYTELVGRPRRAPEWIFRPWVSRNSYLGAYEVDYVVDRMEELGMPVGVVVLEAWEDQLHNFKFAERRYPDAQAWIAKLKERGVHVICWLTSSMWEGTEAYNQAKERGYLVLNPDGSEHVVRWLENGRKVDFRKPGVFEWWRDLHKPLVEMGISGFKTDGGEHMPDPFFHNEHTYRYQKAALDAFDDLGREGITFARSASPLNAGLGAFWAGDQEAEWSRLRSVVRGGLSAALSGFPLWAHDIGAYTGNPSKELYIRWLQLGAFSPLMQFHGIEAREPWHFDRETIDISRFYFQLREKLIPRLAAWGQEAVRDGVPIMRPLIWHYPDDDGARGIDDEFMLGPDILVAPITDPVDQRGVYLPAGTWRDLWSGEEHVGPVRFIYESPLARIPVFVRGDAYGDYAALAENAPALPANAVTIELAGDRDHRNIVPALRYWRDDQSSERVYYEIRNGTDRAALVDIALPAPDGFSVDPPHPFRLEVPAGGTQRLAFTVQRIDANAHLTYPLRLRAAANGEQIDVPPVGIVLSPTWHTTGLFEGGIESFQSLDGQPVHPDATFTGKYARVFGWSEVPDSARSDDGRYDLASISGKDGWSSTYLTAKLVVPRTGSYTVLAGFGDQMTVWLDGKEIRSITGHRNPLRDEDRIPVRLTAGTHEIVVRNSRDLSPPHFYFRMID